MTYYMMNGANVMLADSADLRVSERLEVGTYLVKYKEITGQFYLQRVDDVTVPGKVYGNPMTRLQRIFRTFDSRDRSTGVLLTGEKGSGKTMLAKMISVEAKARGIPTIMVNSAYRGDGFNKFIQDIEQDCVIVFDEFEKVYDVRNGQQTALLTLFDGVFTTKKLFVLTGNNIKMITPLMFNRPGRVFYHYKYEGLDVDFVREYSQDNLIDKSRVEEVVKLSVMFESFNFDVMQAVVEEMNRFNEPAAATLENLNVSPENLESSFSVSVYRNDGGKIGKAVTHSSNFATLDPMEFEHKTLVGPGADRYHSITPTERNALENVSFTNEDFYSIDAKNRTFTYKKDEYFLVLKKSPKYQFNMKYAIGDEDL